MASGMAPCCLFFVLAFSLAAGGPVFPFEGMAVQSDRVKIYNGVTPPPRKCAPSTYDDYSAAARRLQQSPVRGVTVSMGGVATAEGRSLYLFKVQPYLIREAGESPPKDRRKALWLEGGLTANDLASSKTLTSYLGDVLHNCEAFGGCNNDFFIVPLANPDGYEYARTTDPSWVKNRQNITVNNANDGRCKGVNLNSNFGTVNDKGPNEDPCSKEYAGLRQGSSAEVRALKNLKLATPKINLAITLTGASEDVVLFPSAVEKRPPAALVNYTKIGRSYNLFGPSIRPVPVKPYSNASRYKESGNSMDFWYTANPATYCFTVQFKSSPGVVGSRPSGPTSPTVTPPGPTGGPTSSKPVTPPGPTSGDPSSKPGTPPGPTSGTTSSKPGSPPVPTSGTTSSKPNAPPGTTSSPSGPGFTTAPGPVGPKETQVSKGIGRMMDWIDTKTDPPVELAGLKKGECIPFETIKRDLYRWSKNNPKITLHSHYNTSEGRPLLMVKVRPYFKPNVRNAQHIPNRKANWIEAGLDGSACDTTAIALEMIQMLSTSCPRELPHCRLDYLFLPVANPDGYERSRTVEPGWAKTMTPSEKSTCRGVSLDRNFPPNANFGQFGGSKDPCAQDYYGKKPASSKEAQAMIIMKSSVANLKLGITLTSFKTGPKTGPKPGPKPQGRQESSQPTSEPGATPPTVDTDSKPVNNDRPRPYKNPPPKPYSKPPPKPESNPPPKPDSKPPPKPYSKPPPKPYSKTPPKPTYNQPPKLDSKSPPNSDAKLPPKQDSRPPSPPVQAPAQQAPKQDPTKTLVLYPSAVSKVPVVPVERYQSLGKAYVKASPNPSGFTNYAEWRLQSGTSMEFWYKKQPTCYSLTLKIPSNRNESIRATTKAILDGLVGMNNDFKLS